jgi:hypothetical protein
MSSDMKLSENTIKVYLTLIDRGENTLYKNAVAAGIKSGAMYINPEVEMLEASDAFYTLYKRTGDERFASISKILKRAANTVYRQFLKIYEDKVRNYRFLNVVK